MKSLKTILGLILLLFITSCNSDKFIITIENDNTRQGFLNVFMEYKAEKIKIDEIRVYDKTQLTPNNDFTISELPSSDFSNFSDENIIYAITYSNEKENWEQYGRDNIDRSRESSTYYVINNENQYTVMKLSFAFFEDGGRARDEYELYTYIKKQAKKAPTVKTESKEENNLEYKIAQKLISNVYESTENSLKTYLHFTKSDGSEGLFGTVTLSNNSTTCKYVYTYDVSASTINTQFYASDCGANSSDMTFNYDFNSDTITTFIDREKFTFHAVF